MPSPFEEGGHTQTIDVPEIEPEPPSRPSSSLPWVIIGVATLVVLVLLAVAIVALGG